MGFFDKLFGKKQKETMKQPTPVKQVEQDKITRQSEKDGKLKCDFLDGKTDKSTSIVVNPKPISVNNIPIYEISIEWYGSDDDTFYYDTNSHGMKWETIYAGIDLNQLQNNDEYLKYTMRALLKEERVRDYLAMAMKTDEEINNEVSRTGNKHIYPCGRYVGNVKQTDKGFVKGFYHDVGKIFHNLPQMQSERKAAKAKKEAKDRINEKRAEIARLEKEIEEEENSRY